MRIKRNKGLILHLNRDFYNKDTIDHAIRDFSRLCKISRLYKEGYHIIRFSGLEMDDLDEVALEFANYVLSLMKSKG